MKVILDFDTVNRKPQIVSSFLPEIREHFSVEDKAMLFMRRRLGRNVPARKYAITNKGHFDLHFYDEIVKELKIVFPSLEIITTDKLLNLITPATISSEIEPLKLEPRDYQIESAKFALSLGKGIIVLPTSAGKTLTMALIANEILKKKNYNILILVPNIQLVEQTYQDFIEYGILKEFVSRWTGSHSFSPTKIVVSNSQILLSEKQDTNVLKRFQAVIVDECHKLATSQKITKLIKTLNCLHIFGFTGSLPENVFDVWSLNRIFGSVIYFKKSIELRQDKFISSVRVVALQIEYKNIPEFTKASMLDPTTGYEEETTWLHTHEYRNNVIASLVNKLETNTLILVDRIVHGQYLLDFLSQKTNKQIFFVQGSVDVEEREQIRELMENTSGVICIAISKIFSTGISIKNLHNVVFASIGKARIKIIQSIGRSLRLHQTKTIATIFDIADNNLYYGKKHFEERKKLYSAENIPIIAKDLVEK